MFFIGYGCSFISGPASFRTAWAMQFIPAVLLMMGLPFLPKSPRWLAKVGQTEAAIQTLARIQAHSNVDDPLVVAEWEEISTVLAAEREAPRGWRKFIKNGMWRRTLAGASVQAWQQLSGAKVMTYCVVYVFLMAGLRGNVNLTSGIQYVLFIIFTGIMFFFIDKTGRRPLLIFGAIGMGICLFVVGGVGGNANVVIQVTGGPAHTVIAFSYLLIIVYTLTLAPVAWIYAAEVWSLETRATGMGLAATANWLFNFALEFFIPPAFHNISWKTFIIFGTLCMGAAIQAFFTYPETCQNTLEEVEVMFNKGGPRPWKTRKGESRLVREVEAVIQRKEQHGEEGGLGGHGEKTSLGGAAEEERVGEKGGFDHKEEV